MVTFVLGVVPATVGAYYLGLLLFAIVGMLRSGDPPLAAIAVFTLLFVIARFFCHISISSTVNY